MNVQRWANNCEDSIWSEWLSETVTHDNRQMHLRCAVASVFKCPSEQSKADGWAGHFKSADAAVEAPVKPLLHFHSAAFCPLPTAGSSEISSSFTLINVKYTLNFLSEMCCYCCVLPLLSATPAAHARYLEFHLEFWDTCKKWNEYLCWFHQQSISRWLRDIYCEFDIFPFFFLF